MTLLFAAVLGNAVAWCVHVFTWWLRRRAFAVMSTLGCAVGCPLGCGFSLLPFPFMPFLSALQSIGILVVFLGVMSFVGALQSHWIEQNDDPFPACFALILELVFAVFVFFFVGIVSFSLLFTNLVFPESRFVFKIYSISFWLTWFLLAIFRPLVVRYTTRFWRLIRPTKTEETS